VVRAQPLEDDRRRHELAFEAVPAIDGHVLDEAHVDRTLLRERDERVDLLLDAAQQQGVDLDRLEAGG